MLPLRWAVLLLVLTPGSMPAHAECAPAALERFLYLGGIEELVAGAPRNARTWALLVARRDGLDAARTAALQEAVVRWPDAAALRASLLQALNAECEPARLDAALATLERGGLDGLRVALGKAGAGLRAAPDAAAFAAAASELAADEARVAAVDGLLAAGRTVELLLLVNAVNAADVEASSARAGGATPTPTNTADAAILQQRAREAQQRALASFARNVWRYALRHAGADQIESARVALADPLVQEFLAATLARLDLMPRDRVRSP